jgi:hypothetical protein
MKATVYYIELTAEQVREINVDGWGCPAGQAYLAAKHGKAPAGVDPASVAALLKPAAIIGDAKTAEDIWTRLQNGVRLPSWTMQPGVVQLTQQPRSMDVGDLIVWEDGRQERCASMGFEPASVKVLCN